MTVGVSEKDSDYYAYVCRNWDFGLALGWGLGTCRCLGGSVREKSWDDVYS